MSADFSSIDFDHYHRVELPRRIAAGEAGNAALGARDLDALGIRVGRDGPTWTYLPKRDAIEIRAGDDDAEIVMELEQRAWEGLVHDLESTSSLLYHGEARCVRGDALQFVKWEAALRALYTGRPVYDPDAVDLRDRSGAPLDPCQGFRLGDDPADMAHYLREAGYLLVRDVFTADEVERLRAEAAVLRERARPDDRLSWWAKSADGESVLCRVLHVAGQPALSSLATDRRLLDVVALADDEMVLDAPEGLDGLSVLWKNPRIEEGLSDLPWHRDCGMGGHATMCPSIVCSIWLARNAPEGGELRFLPGSWRQSYRVEDAADEQALRGVTPPAQPGDITIHYGDGWHAAPPPTSADGPFRMAVLLAFRRLGAWNHRGGRHYNDVLLDGEGGRPQDVKSLASRS